MNYNCETLEKRVAKIEKKLDNVEMALKILCETINTWRPAIKLWAEMTQEIFKGIREMQEIEKNQEMEKYAVRSVR